MKTPAQTFFTWCTDGCHVGVKKKKNPNCLESVRYELVQLWDLMLTTVCLMVSWQCTKPFHLHISRHTYTHTRTHAQAYKPTHTSCTAARLSPKPLQWSPEINLGNPHLQVMVPSHTHDDTINTDTHTHIHVHVLKHRLTAASVLSVHYVRYSPEPQSLLSPCKTAETHDIELESTFDF